MTVASFALATLFSGLAWAFGATPDVQAAAGLAGIVTVLLIGAAL